jgi:hypothetical protein
MNTPPDKKKKMIKILPRTRYRLTRLLVVKETRINRADTEPCCTFFGTYKTSCKSDSSFLCFTRFVFKTK